MNPEVFLALDVVVVAVNERRPVSADAELILQQSSDSRDHGQAVRVGTATWLGMMVGLLAKVALAFVMVGIFVVALVF